MIFGAKSPEISSIWKLFFSQNHYIRTIIIYYFMWVLKLVIHRFTWEYFSSHEESFSFQASDEMHYLMMVMMMTKNILWFCPLVLLCVWSKSVDLWYHVHWIKMLLKMLSKWKMCIFISPVNPDQTRPYQQQHFTTHHNELDCQNVINIPMKLVVFVLSLFFSFFCTICRLVFIVVFSLIVFILFLHLFHYIFLCFLLFSCVHCLCAKFSMACKLFKRKKRLWLPFPFYWFTLTASWPNHRPRMSCFGDINLNLMCIKLCIWTKYLVIW